MERDSEHRRARRLRIYYDFLFPPNLETERAALGPPGLGRLPFTGDSIPNPIAGIPGVPLGTPLDFTRATAFLGSHFVSILPQTRASLLPTVSSNSGVQYIQLTKTLAGGGLNTDFPSMYAIHAGTGVRRQIGRTFELGADFVYRRFVHVGIGATDANRHRRAQGPLLPVCTASQRTIQMLCAPPASSTSHGPWAWQPTRACWCEQKSTGRLDTGLQLRGPIRGMSEPVEPAPRVQPQRLA